MGGPNAKMNKLDEMNFVFYFSSSKKIDYSSFKYGHQAKFLVLIKNINKSVEF